MGTRVSANASLLRTSTRCPLTNPRHTIATISRSKLGCLPSADISNRAVGGNRVKSETVRNACVGFTWAAIRHPSGYKLAVVPLLAEKTSF